MRTLVLLAAVTACSAEQVFEPMDFGLERMMVQPRADAFEATPFFADGRVMRAPPEGTVASDRVTGPPDLTLGYTGPVYAAQIPMTVTRELLAHGRERFDIFCAPCHGVLGDSDSVVSRNMPLVRPRSVLDPAVRAYPPGRMYRIVNEGYGMMAGYATQLDIAERWAVVAYVQALQLSQSVNVATLGPEVQRRLQEQAP